MSSTNYDDDDAFSETIEINPLIVVLFFGLISFFADFIYEGGRSITPSYLKIIGYSATIVGVIIGAAEAVGYILRLVSGKIADKTRSYWVFIFLGYGLLIVVPLIGMTKSVILISIFIFLERIAKGLRSPSKDAVFSVLTKKMGSGKAFGLHEFLDQLGAVTGPFLIMAVLYKSSTYPDAYKSLFTPYFILFLTLLIVYYITRKPFHVAIEKEIQQANNHPEKTKLTSSFWYYTFSVSINTIFLFPLSMILYVSTNILLDWQIPLLFILIQGIDAFSAIIFGWLYDHMGEKILVIIFILSVLPSIILFQLSSVKIIIFGAIIFGIVFGAQESIYRAAIVNISAITKRGSAYGYFNAFYGISLGIAGLLFGFAIDHLLNPFFVLIIVIIMQLIAVFFLNKSIHVKNEK